MATQNNKNREMQFDVFNPQNLFMFHPLLFFSATFFIVVVVSLIQGRVTRRYTTLVSRDEESTSFWNYIGLYAILGTVSLFFTVKN